MLTTPSPDIPRYKVNTPPYTGQAQNIQTQISELSPFSFLQPSGIISPLSPSSMSSQPGQPQHLPSRRAEDQELPGMKRINM